MKGGSLSPEKFFGHQIKSKKRADCKRAQKNNQIHAKPTGEESGPPFAGVGGANRGRGEVEGFLLTLLGNQNPQKDQES